MSSPRHGGVDKWKALEFLRMLSDRGVRRWVNTVGGMSVAAGEGAGNLLPRANQGISKHRVKHVPRIVSLGKSFLAGLQ